MAAACLLPVIYLPYAWLLFVDKSWGSYRWHWIKSWPGLPLRMVLQPHINQWSATTEIIISTAATVPLVILIVFLGTRGRLALAVTSAATLLASLLNSGYAYTLFLM